MYLVQESKNVKLVNHLVLFAQLLINALNVLKATMLIQNQNALNAIQIVQYVVELMALHVLNVILDIILHPATNVKDVINHAQIALDLRILNAHHVLLDFS